MGAELYETPQAVGARANQTCGSYRSKGPPNVLVESKALVEREVYLGPGDHQRMTVEPKD